MTQCENNNNCRVTNYSTLLYAAPLVQLASAHYTARHYTKVHYTPWQQAQHSFPEVKRSSFKTVMRLVICPSVPPTPDRSHRLHISCALLHALGCFLRQDRSRQRLATFPSFRISTSGPIRSPVRFACFLAYIPGFSPPPLNIAPKWDT